MSCVTCTGKHPCHSDTLWLKKRACCRSLQRPSRRSLDRRAATHSCISCKSCCVFLGCRRCSFVHTPQLYTTGTKCSNTPRRVPTRQRVIHSIAYLAVTLPINRLWWLFLDIPESLSISLVISRRYNQPTSSNSPTLIDSSMPRVTPPRSPRSEPAQAAASGADSSVGPSVPPTPDQRSEPAAAETQAAAPSADSLGVSILGCAGVVISAYAACSTYITT